MSKSRIPKDVRNAVWSRAKCKCEACGGNIVCTIHHIIPHCFGGKATLDNLILVCRDCYNLAHNPISGIAEIRNHKYYKNPH